MKDKKKVVVIGSNSFSGSDFIDLLLEKKEYSVIGISRSPEKSNLFLPYKRLKKASFEFYQFDMNNPLGSTCPNIPLIILYNREYGVIRQTIFRIIAPEFLKFRIKNV